MLPESLQPSTYRKLPLLTLSCIGHAYGLHLKDFLGFTYPTTAIGNKDAFQSYFNEEQIIEETSNFLKNKNWEQVLTKTLEVFEEIKPKLTDKSNFLTNLIRYYPTYMACIGVYNCLWRYMGNTAKFFEGSIQKIEEARQTIAQFYPQVEAMLKEEVKKYPERDLLLLCTIKELGIYLSQKKLPPDIKLRANKYLYTFDEEEKVTTDSKVINQMEKQFETTVSEFIQGYSAFPGKVEGVACNLKHGGKIMKGSIIVTNMTSPNDYGRLQGAKALVTDEGGILSHAAILARELKIPTIIGTKNATILLKDGDLVEVDADKGVVKKIK